MARTLARSYMLVDRKSTNNTAPRATAITTYQKRERSILVPFPGVGLGAGAFFGAFLGCFFGSLADRDGDVDDGTSQHEGARAAYRRAAEESLQCVLAGRKLRNDEHALG